MNCDCWLVRRQGNRGQKAGAPVLDNPRLDAILAAADAGCFATYIMKQGGVLVPRKYHLIRTAYEINEEPTAYGDHGIRILWHLVTHCRGQDLHSCSEVENGS